MKICCISDTHCRHYALTIPDSDVLCHAGDFSSVGDGREVEEFLDWYSKQKAKYKIYIAGNHDLSYEGDSRFKEYFIDQYPDLIYLEDDYATIDGVVFYGTPWQPRFYDWAFNLERGGYELAAKWAAIPSYTNVLITHGPPQNILDFVPYCGKNEGCEMLAERVSELPDLKLHLFGHMHSPGGQSLVQDGVTFVNASVCTEKYRPTQKIVVVDI